MNDYYSFLSLTIINIIISFFILIKLDYLARLFNLIDFAKGKAHSNDTPKYGFFVFFLIISTSLFINIIYFKSIDYYVFLFYLLSFLLIGFLDDVYDLKVWKRLVLATIVVSLFFYFNYKEYYVSSNFQNVSNYLLLIFFTLGFIHLVNITDGLNGLISSLFTYSCIYYFFKGFYDYDSFYQLFIISNITIFIIFLIPNFFGICFLGNTGAYLIAIITSILYLELYKISTLEYSDILLIYLIPLIDGLRVTVNRMLKKTSPFKGDLTHIHHKIRGNKFFTIIYFSLVFLPSIINYIYIDYTIYIGLSFIFFFIIFIFYVEKQLKIPN